MIGITITLDPEWIAIASMNQYTVGIESTISKEWLTKLLSVIDTRLRNDGLLNSNGTLKSGAELLAAYLICDIIKGVDPKTDKKSESYGDSYSYTKFESASSGTTNFMQKYLAELPLWNRGKHASAGVERVDKNIGFAKLDQGAYPTVTTTEFNL